jgi:GST-like protein
VQVAFEESGLPYERIWVGKDAEALAAYRRINPTGKVPALALPDGTIIGESAAMLIHLAAAHPEARFAPPPGTSRHALFLQRMVFLSANVYEAVLRIYYAERYLPAGAAADAVEAVREKGTADYLSFLELIAGSLGPYVLGASWSLADPYLHMLAGWSPLEKAVLHARIPALGAHAALIGARPAVVRVDADHAAS